MKSIILYHGQCTDGFGSAFAAWKKFKDEAEYYPCVYGQPLPEVPAGSDVYMIDFSVGREEMLSLLSHCDGNLTVLDHHKSAEENLRGLESFCTFDMNRSGAMMAWNHFHPGVEPLQLIKYIQDRDLWTKKLAYTEEVHAALSSYPQDFNVWDEFYLDNMIKEGKALIRYRKQLVSIICDKSEICELDGHSVALVNATSHWSECGEELLKRYPKCDYAATWYLDGTAQKWSLRSLPGFDVSVIAKKRGGGGHACASGYVEYL